MTSITRQSPSYFNLCLLTAKKINVEAGKTERSLRHLVLLCNTYDAQTLHLLDNHDRQKRKPDEELSAYELYSSPNVEVSVTECSALSESSDEDENDVELWSETESDSKVELAPNDCYTPMPLSFKICYAQAVQCNQPQDFEKLCCCRNQSLLVRIETFDRTGRLTTAPQGNESVEFCYT